MLKIRFSKNIIVLISAVVVALMLIQTVSLTYVANSQKIIQYNIAAGGDFEKCAEGFETKLNKTKEAAMIMLNDKNVYNMLFKEEITHEDKMNFNSAYIEYIKNNIYGISNIFIYNDAVKKIYSKGFFEKDISEIPDNITKKYILNATNDRKKFDFFVGNQNFVYAGYNATDNENQVLRMKFLTSKKNAGCLLVDMKLNDISDIFAEFKDSFNCDMYVEDKNGKSIFGKETKIFRYAEKNDNSPIFKENHTEYFVLCKSTDDAKITAIINTENIKAGYSERRNLAVTNMVTIFVLVILAGFIVVLMYVYDTVKKNEHMQTLNEIQRRSNQLMQTKEHIINCLFYPDDYDIIKAKEYIASVMPSGEYTKLFLMRIDISDYKEFAKKQKLKNVSLYKYGIINICEEILNRYFKTLTIYEQNEYIIFAVIYCNEDYIEKAHLAYEECNAEVLNYIGEGLCGFVSRLCDVEEMNAQNDILSKMAEYKFIYEEPVFLDYSIAERENQNGSTETKKHINELCNSFFEENGEITVNEFFEWLKGLDISEIRKMLLILPYAILGHINSRISETNISEQQCAENINNAESLSQVYKYIMTIMNSVRASRADEGSYFIRRVTAYIDENCESSDLCSDFIADKLGMNKAYLLRKFKQTAGMSIQEAINVKRLERLAERLVGSDESVRSIITSLGVSNHNYFMVMFKKKYSMTPTEYRQRYRK